MSGYLTVSVDTSGTDKIVSAFINLPQELNAKIPARLWWLTHYVKRQIRAQAPSRTGKLRKSINVRKIDQFNYEIFEGQPYGELQRKGTTSHAYMIFPREKQALYWPGLGHPIPFVGPPVTAFHPGFRANPYDVRGMEASADQIEKSSKIITDDIRRVLGG